MTTYAATFLGRSVTDMQSWLTGSAAVASDGYPAGVCSRLGRRGLRGGAPQVPPGSSAVGARRPALHGARRGTRLLPCSGRCCAQLLRNVYAVPWTLIVTLNLAQNTSTHHGPEHCCCRQPEHQASPKPLYTRSHEFCSGWSSVLLARSLLDAAHPLDPSRPMAHTLLFG